MTRREQFIQSLLNANVQEQAATEIIKALEADPTAAELVPLLDENSAKMRRGGASWMMLVVWSVAIRWLEANQPQHKAIVWMKREIVMHQKKKDSYMRYMKKEQTVPEPQPASFEVGAKG